MIRTPTRAAAAAALTLTLAAGAPAISHAATPARDLIVSNAWSRPTPNGLKTGVAYMTITNPGSTPDRLIGAATPVAQTMALHRSTMTNGVMSMAAVPGGAGIPAGGALTLAPGGYHFMLTGLKSGLAAGSAFPVTLSFAHAGKLQVEVLVRNSAPAGPMAGMRSVGVSP